MSNLSCIGFKITDEEDFMNLAVNIANSSDGIRTNQGDYYFWRENPELVQDHMGPELYVSVIENDIAGMTPYFRGKSTMKLGVINDVKDSNAGPLDCSVYAWLDPNDNDPMTGICPAIIEMCCRYNYDMKFPLIDTFSVSAFPQEPLEIYSSEDDYYSHGAENETINMGSKSFIPSGLFSVEQNTTESNNSSHPYAIFYGHILETKQRMNTETNNRYQWALVETLGGTIDVVADDTTTLGKVLEVGNIIGGSFWLCADLK